MWCPGPLSVFENNIKELLKTEKKQNDLFDLPNLGIGVSTPTGFQKIEIYYY